MDSTGKFIILAVDPSEGAPDPKRLLGATIVSVEFRFDHPEHFTVPSGLQKISGQAPQVTLTILPMAGTER